MSSCCTLRGGSNRVNTYRCKANLSDTEDDREDARDDGHVGGSFALGDTGLVKLSMTAAFFSSSRPQNRVLTKG
jgi:hypothetical protein